MFIVCFDKQKFALRAFVSISHKSSKLVKSLGIHTRVREKMMYLFFLQIYLLRNQTKGLIIRKIEMEKGGIQIVYIKTTAHNV